MGGIVQEKFQVEFLPLDDDNGHHWETDKSARVKKGTPSASSAAYNTLPPGSDVTDQEMADLRQMPLVTSGTSDVSMDTNPQSMKHGYKRLDMKPTDDTWTNEHVDAFYGEGKSDGLVGFLERNNMLDRN